jgi:plasmid stabilization system protein ParE
MKGRIGPEADMREFVISHYPYIVVYRLQADSVHILRILHASAMANSIEPSAVASTPVFI